MSKFNKLYEAIIRSKTPEEIDRDKILYIQEWVKEFKAREDVTQNSDGTWNCSGNIDLDKMNLTRLPLKFGKVSGYFWCSHNQLTTLEGAPKKVRESFHCEYNLLTTLEGAPKKVDGYFWCNNNPQLTSLEGAPKEVSGDFWCSNNQLTSLEGAPKEVDGSFWCNYNPGPNGNGFTKEEVRDVCDVKGKIRV